MKFLTRAALAASFVLIASPSLAQRTVCDVDYVIQEGDTLPDIAETAFGRRTYTLIYARNFGKIVNPGDLPVGEKITIPCLPGDASQTPDADALARRMAGGGADEASDEAADKPAPAEVAIGEAAAAPADGVTPATEASSPVAAPSPEDAATSSDASGAGETAPAHRFLTASGQSPYADEALRNGGMATDLTARAMAKAGDPDDYEIVFINDRKKHLRELLQKGSFDVAFPWVRPNCERIEALRQIAPDEAWMCERLAFSEPYYEIVSGFFVLRGGGSSRSAFEDFATARICRPDGPSILDLNVNGLTEEFADFYRPKRAEDCLQLLISGAVDAVSADVFEVESAIADLGVEEAVEELPDLSLLTAIVAAAPRDRPGAMAALDTLNLGMLELKLSGEWYRVVARHLAHN